MFGSVLIANRGEIAVRIARTAQAMGIRTVGVYSEADRTALHTDVVDLAVYLGGETAAESYLRGDAIIDAALATGAAAIHPGYGFLAENAAFAQSVIDAGLVWVGPAPEHIELLGDKVRAKGAALEAGVPTTPVFPVVDGRVPADVPFPALVKAAAGGGGRGMRVVESADGLEAALAAASREALAAFGDGSVFIEPFISSGRHIEVQVFGDAHGNVVHLGERECSIQRRNQKIVEEAPSAGIGDAVRATLLEGAVALASHVGYLNAGTVEFLVGDDETITFLEVNTRLQVEHPVTEAVTGLDLVELQLRIAAGEELPLQQDDVVVQGHAIEVRVVAEDPNAGWLPSTGRLDSFDFVGNVRVDTGFRAGDDVTPHYDSLLAKVIAHRTDRRTAAAALARTLRSASVTGVATNAAHASAILGDADFVAARTSTSFLADHPDLGEAATDLDPCSLLAAVFAAEGVRRASDAVTGFAPSAWRNLRTRGVRETWVGAAGVAQVEYELAGDRAQVAIGPWPEPTEDGSLSVDDRVRHDVRLLRRSAGELALEIDGIRHLAATSVSMTADRVTVATPTVSASWHLEPRFVVPDSQSGNVGPVCPLPGTVIAVHVAPGDAVEDGDLLVVVEAMKMEHAINAAGPGTVQAVPFDVGDRVDAGDILVEFESVDE